MGFKGYSQCFEILKEIGNFTVQNVSRRFRKAYYTPGLLFWGVFFIYLQFPTLTIGIIVI